MLINTTEKKGKNILLQRMKLNSKPNNSQKSKEGELAMCGEIAEVRKDDYLGSTIAQLGYIFMIDYMKKHFQNQLPMLKSFMKLYDPKQINRIKNNVTNNTPSSVILETISKGMNIVLWKHHFEESKDITKDYSRYVGVPLLCTGSALELFGKNKTKLDSFEYVGRVKIGKELGKKTDPESLVFKTSLFGVQEQNMIIKTTSHTNNDLARLHLFEYFIGYHFINKIRCLIPNFMYTYGAFQAHPVLSSECPIKIPVSFQGDKPNLFIMYEHVPGVSLMEYIRNIENDVSKIKMANPTIQQIEELTKRLNNVGDFVLQVVMALAVAQTQGNYVHNDLHAENIIIRQVNNAETIHYCFDGKVYRIETTEIATIIDYGYNRCLFECLPIGNFTMREFNIDPCMNNSGYDVFRMVMTVVYALEINFKSETNILHKAKTNLIHRLMYPFVEVFKECNHIGNDFDLQQLQDDEMYCDPFEIVSTYCMYWESVQEKDKQNLHKQWMKLLQEGCKNYFVEKTQQTKTINFDLYFYNNLMPKVYIQFSKSAAKFLMTDDETHSNHSVIGDLLKSVWIPHHPEINLKHSLHKLFPNSSSVVDVEQCQKLIDNHSLFTIHEQFIQCSHLRSIFNANPVEQFQSTPEVESYFIKESSTNHFLAIVQQINKILDFEKIILKRFDENETHVPDSTIIQNSELKHYIDLISQKVTNYEQSLPYRKLHSSMLQLKNEIDEKKESMETKYRAILFSFNHQRKSFSNLLHTEILEAVAECHKYYIILFQYLKFIEIANSNQVETFNDTLIGFINEFWNPVYVKMLHQVQFCLLYYYNWLNIHYFKKILVFVSQRNFYDVFSLSNVVCRFYSVNKKVIHSYILCLLTNQNYCIYYSPTTNIQIRSLFKLNKFSQIPRKSIISSIHKGLSTLFTLNIQQVQALLINTEQILNAVDEKYFDEAITHLSKPNPIHHGIIYDNYFYLKLLTQHRPNQNALEVLEKDFIDQISNHITNIASQPNEKLWHHLYFGSGNETTMIQLKEKVNNFSISVYGMILKEMNKQLLTHYSHHTFPSEGHFETVSLYNNSFVSINNEQVDSISCFFTLSQVEFVDFYIHLFYEMQKENGLLFVYDWNPLSYENETKHVHQLTRIDIFTIVNKCLKYLLDASLTLETVTQVIQNHNLFCRTEKHLQKIIESTNKYRLIYKQQKNFDICPIIFMVFEKIDQE